MRPQVISYVGVFETFWNQTEIYEQLKTAHEKLKIHDKIQKDFINLIAHELRTPLTPIIGLTEYVKERTTDVKHRELLNRVIKDAKKLSELNENIIDVTRFESKLFKLNKNKFSLNHLVSQIIENMRLSYQDLAKEIKFELFNVDNEYLVYADKYRISQVICSLIDNSIKSISEKESIGGTITISMKETKIERTDNKGTNNEPIVSEDKLLKMIIVSVTDTGKGIDRRDTIKIVHKVCFKIISRNRIGTIHLKKYYRGAWWEDLG